MFTAIANCIGTGVGVETRGSELITNGSLDELGANLFTNADFDGNINGWNATSLPSGGGVNWNLTGGNSVRLQTYYGFWNQSYVYQSVLSLSTDYKASLQLYEPIQDTDVTFHLLSDTGTNYTDFTSSSLNYNFIATGSKVGFRVVYIGNTINANTSNFILSNNFKVQELNPNASSQWNLVSGWSIDNINGKFVASNTNNQMFQNNITLEVADYEVKYTLERTAGYFRVRIGNSSYNNGVSRWASGDYTETISCTNASNNKLYLDGYSSPFTGSVSNISVRKIL